MMDLKQHLLRQMAFSHATYGPGKRTAGLVDHIRKELVEIIDGEGAPIEWVDVVILALDGLTRELIYRDNGGGRGDPGNAADMACRLICTKQTINEGRDWPDWRTQPQDRAIEHIGDGFGGHD